MMLCEWLFWSYNHQSHPSRSASNRSLGWFGTAKHCSVPFDVALDIPGAHRLGFSRWGTVRQVQQAYLVPGIITGQQCSEPVGQLVSSALQENTTLLASVQLLPINPYFLLHRFHYLHFSCFSQDQITFTAASFLKSWVLLLPYHIFRESKKSLVSELSFEQISSHTNQLKMAESFTLEIHQWKRTH